ncbi:MAG: DUF930 domain-containing protein [Devosia sp.]
MSVTALRPGGGRLTAGIASSLLLHVLLLAAALFLTPLRSLVVPPPAPIEVQILTPDQLDALFPAPAVPSPPVVAQPAPLAAPPAEAAPEPGAGGEAATPTTPAPVHATHISKTFYAADLLQQPDMARIRRGLTQFAGSERLVQICNIESLEQIRRAEPEFEPDTMVAYAMTDMMSSGLTLLAPGAAFRSRRKWYGVSFHCTAATGYEAVTAFSFTIGDPIPEEQWEAHSLNAADADE